MPENSIHNPAYTENAQPKKPFPTSGDNFTFVIALDGDTDPIAVLEAIDFLDDYMVALTAFEHEVRRTGTV